MDRFKELLEKDKADNRDIERKALFWILANNNDLYSKKDHIYDFKNHEIRPECLEGTIDLSSGSRSLVMIGFSLYNRFPADLSDCFSSLDQENFTIAIEAINIRFSNYSHNFDLRNS